MTYTHLTKEERYQIEVLRREKYSQIEIAQQLGRSRTTIYRELKRNKGERVWRAPQADEAAKQRLKTRGKKNARKVSEETWAYAKHQLTTEQWSPEQIAGRLKYKEAEGVSHEWLYQRIYIDKKEGGKLYTHLRCQKLRRRRYASSRASNPKIINRIGIEERPAIVDERSRLGDWEGDTIIGAGNSGVIITSVDRVSRLTRLAKIETKSAAGVTQALIEKMRFFKGIAHTLTVDNGGEFAYHEEIAAALEIKVYFARPYHSWERGTNENTNGLVRQYFGKKMRFDTITDDEVQFVADKLNQRPRKCLDYMTPNEVFNKECEKKGVALRV